MPGAKVDSSTVASMIALESSCSIGGGLAAEPSSWSTSLSSCRRKSKSTCSSSPVSSSTKSLAASVTASFRSATSVESSGVRRQTAERASRASTRYPGFAGIVSETSRLAASIPRARYSSRREMPALISVRMDSCSGRFALATIDI